MRSRHNVALRPRNTARLDGETFVALQRLRIRNYANSWNVNPNILAIHQLNPLLC